MVAADVIAAGLSLTTALGEEGYAAAKVGEQDIEVNHLTHLATLSLPVESDDGQEEVALASHILKDMGMDCIQDYHQPIHTIACQHCGNFQFALPSADVAFKGLTEQNNKHVH